MIVLVCAVIGAILNRFSGFTNVSWLPGRNVYYSLLALLVLSTIAFGPIWGFLITLSAGCYRLPGWYDSIDMGRNEGSLIQDFAVMFVRGLFFFPVFMIAWLFLPVQHSFAYLVSASLIATFAYVAGNYALRGKVKDPFVYIELIAGAAFGAAVGGLMVAVNG